MPAKYEMTWEPTPRRWRKMWGGRYYTVSCKQLGVKPETKDASYRAANEWWSAKREELEGRSPRVGLPPYHPHESDIAFLERQRDWARRHGQPELAGSLSGRIEAVKKLAPDDAAVADADEDRRIEDYLKIVRAAESEPDPVTAKGMLREAFVTPLWAERLRLDREAAPVPEDQAVKGQVAAWLERQRVRVNTGQLSPGKYDNNRRAVEFFRDFVSGELNVSQINGVVVDRFFSHCFSKVESRSSGGEGWSAEYAKSVFGTVRTFIRSLWGKGLLELPRNLDSTEFRFGVTPKRIIPISVDEFRRLYVAATGQLRLHLLLMANCGMRSTDIADLKDSEVDWTVGRVIRKRSKTRRFDDVPVVNYLLWKPTIDLLREYRSGGEVLLRTKTGGLWAWEEMLPGGKLRCSDNIATNYNRLRNSPKLKIDKPLSAIRKGGASILNAHENYGGYAIHYLGESPRTIKDKHYAAPSVELFDTIIKWLGGQFGIEALGSSIIRHSSTSPENLTRK